jgi:hypothetical protein
VIIELANEGMDTIESYSSYALVIIENLTLLGTENINGAGNSLAKLLQAIAGNNVLVQGAAGNDTLIGGLVMMCICLVVGQSKTPLIIPMTVVVMICCC